VVVPLLVQLLALLLYRALGLKRHLALVLGLFVSLHELRVLRLERRVGVLDDHIVVLNLVRELHGLVQVVAQMPRLTRARRHARI
jgi:hypothetical protein